MPNREIMTNRRHRFRRIAKWIGTGATMLILVAWVSSVPLLGTKTTVFEGNYARNWIAVDRGLMIYEFGARPRPGRLKVYCWDEGPERRQWPIWVRYGLIAPTVERFPTPAIYHLILPLWLPFLLVITPTAYLWNRDRRRISPGHCPSCNYNLTGNTSGICPECGTPCQPASVQA